jgi:hypothetical protein
VAGKECILNTVTIFTPHEITFYDDEIKEYKTGRA